MRKRLALALSLTLIAHSQSAQPYTNINLSSLVITFDDTPAEWKPWQYRLIAPNQKVTFNNPDIASFMGLDITGQNWVRHFFDNNFGSTRTQTSFETVAQFSQTVNVPPGRYDHRHSIFHPNQVSPFASTPEPTTRLISGHMLVPVEEKINLYVSNNTSGEPFFPDPSGEIVMLLVNFGFIGYTQQGDDATGCSRWVTPTVHMTGTYTRIGSQEELLALPKGIHIVDNITSCSAHPQENANTINGCHADGRIAVRYRSDIARVWNVMIHELGHYYGLRDLYGEEDFTNYMFSAYNPSRNHFRSEQCANLDRGRV